MNFKDPEAMMAIIGIVMMLWLCILASAVIIKFIFFT